MILASDARVLGSNPGWAWVIRSSLCIVSDSSVGKVSACNAGDPGSISGSGRLAGEGIGYPLQYSWASLVAQLVKNVPAMWETWVLSLAWEDALKKGKATQSSILAWRIPWLYKWQPTPVFLPGESQGQGSLMGYCLWGRTESDTTEAT